MTVEHLDYIARSDFAAEQSHAVHLLSARLVDRPETRTEDLEIFADYAEGNIDFDTFKRRLETGEE